MSPLSPQYPQGRGGGGGARGDPPGGPLRGPPVSN